MHRQRNSRVIERTNVPQPSRRHLIRLIRHAVFWQEAFILRGCFQQITPAPNTTSASSLAFSSIRRRLSSERHPPALPVQLAVAPALTLFTAGPRPPVGGERVVGIDGENGFGESRRRAQE